MKKIYSAFSPDKSVSHSFLQRLTRARLLACCFLFFLLPGNEAKAQITGVKTAGDSLGVYDEISVAMLIDGYGNISADILYTENNLLYINIESLFKKLKIVTDVSPFGNSIYGNLENETQAYLIDYNLKEIDIGSRKISVNKGLAKENGIIYIESSLLAEAFGITVTFNFRSLTCILKSTFEFPLLKEMRLQKMRNNLSKIQGEIKPDTIIKRSYHLFKPGMADWGFTTTQISNIRSLNRFNVGFGTELLFGEANISYDSYNQPKFDSRQLNYLWRWVDNDKKVIRQAQAGRISTNTFSFINAPINGVLIRNTPTTLRKATGHYFISEKTEPNWDVELYINNVLVDYTKADPSGFFNFKVPIVYGYTTLTLKFYGLAGEERIVERTTNNAFTLLPAKEFEYSLSGGLLQDSLNSSMGRAELNYGVNRTLTLGGGLEYLSSIPGANKIPFAKMSLQPFSKLLITAEYAHSVKTRAFLNYSFRKNSFLEIDYALFKEGQMATPFNAIKELKAKLSMPLRFKSLGGYTNLQFARFVYANTDYTQASVVLSGYFKEFGMNSTTEIFWTPQKNGYVATARSTLGFSVRLKNGFNVRPSAIYSLNDRKISMYNAEIEKNIKRGFISLSYQQNITYNNYVLGATLKYDLRFARTNLSTLVSKNTVTTSQNAQGSFAFGSGNNNVHASQLSSLGKGGISVYPFLDMNDNGVFDKGERMVKLTSLKIMSSNVLFDKKDSIIRIPGLQAFTNYNLQFNDRDLENISWRFRHQLYQVLIDPNQFKRIDIPVTVMGEVNGLVFLNNGSSTKGMGRILVKIYKRNEAVKIAETLSETDGYFQYLGLKSGEYTARLDSVQLAKLGLSAITEALDFTIRPNEQGDIAGPLNFILKKEIIPLPGEIIKQ
ncbi:MAG: hypothetical protein H7X88_02060 [Gloeobacteraceae cyanobacterium ES-bin-316]|nr:hypothetical protein [Ferruginibacter sp.]